MSDTETALGKLRALAGAVDEARAVTVVHEGRPIPMERIRFNPKQQRFFKGGKSRQAEQDMVFAFRLALNRRLPLADTVAIVALFYVPTHQRKDVDNLMKLVMDAGTKARVWLDDSQVIAQASFLELDAARPRTVVALCPYLGSMSTAPLLTGSGAI